MTARQRWPAGAEQHRQDAADASEVARGLLRDARRLLRDSQRHLKTNPSLKEMMDLEAVSLIADAETMIADIQRFLTEAKHGQ